MAEHRTYPLLPEDRCLTEEQLFAYIDGRLPDAERHRAEKHMLDCPFCSDALEGLLLVKNRDKVAATGFFPANGSGNKEEKEKTKVIPLHRNRRSLYAIAAAVVLLIGVTVVMKLTLNTDSSPLAQSSEESNLDPASEELLSMDSTVATIDNLKQKNWETPAPGEQETATGNAPGDAPSQSGPGSSSTVTAKIAEAEDELQQEQVVVIQDANTGDKTAGGSSSGADDKQRAQPAKDTDVKAETRLEEAKEKDKLVLFQKTDSRNDRSKNNKKETAAPPEAAGTTAPSAPSGGTQSGAADVDDVYETAKADTVSSPRLYRNLATDEDLDLCYENGVKMLDSGQAAASITFFDQVLVNPSHHYFEDAQWKKAEALLKLNRNEEAKTLLNEIVQKGGKYKSQAKEKLKKL